MLNDNQISFLQLNVNNQSENLKDD